MKTKTIIFAVIMSFNMLGQTEKIFINKLLSELTELNDGFAYKPCNHDYDKVCEYHNITKAISPKEYIVLHALSTRDNGEDFGIEKRRFLGYFKGNEETIGIITLADNSNDSISILGRPELLVYNKDRKKIGSYRIEIEDDACKNMTKFSIVKQSILIHYSCTDTIKNGYDYEGNEINNYSELHKKHSKISFNQNTITIDEDTVVYKETFTGEYDDNYNPKILYETVYANGKKRKSNSWSNTKEIIKPDGTIIKGLICGDDLCPYVYLGNYVLLAPQEKSISTSIKKDDLFKISGIKATGASVMSYELVFKIESANSEKPDKIPANCKTQTIIDPESKLVDYYGNGSEFSNDIKKALESIKVGKKLFIDYKIKTVKGTIESHTFGAMVR